ncbi:MAG: hypothetical protein JSV09_10020 [Thermoplasmata archaeon]|nr:MAG: hypothetical protein JSV09_10020 [Thermoplasmata archaeon]
MEKENVQIEENDPKISMEKTDSDNSTPKPATAIPLLITIIGIFCYLGVVLPSVFSTSTRFSNYTTFDMLIMVLGAALVGLGAYFWFKVRSKIYREDKKAAELA